MRRKRYIGIYTYLDICGWWAVMALIWAVVCLVRRRGSERYDLVCSVLVWRNMVGGEGRMVMLVGKMSTDFLCGLVFALVRGLIILICLVRLLIT